MARKILKLKITGASPILLHNGQTVDPLNKFAKAMKQVSSKKKKTDSDFAEMAKIEWFASLYTQDNRICIPGEVWESALVSGAKKLKLGKQAQAAIFCPENALLEFDGCELTPDQLWERDQNRLTVGVRVQQNKVMRTRFKADKWSCNVAIEFDDSTLNHSQVVDIVQACGDQCGICDWRPKFGRFSVEETGKSKE